MKDYLIIGSQAMKHHFPDFERLPMDTDVIIKDNLYYELIAGNEDVEYVHENPNGLSAIVKIKSIASPFEYFFADKQKSLQTILSSYTNSEEKYAKPGVIYSLKKSHIHYPIKFHKHIQDYMFLRRKLRENLNVSIEEDLKSDEDLLDMNPSLTKYLIEDTEERLGKLRTPKMNQSADQFFGKSKKYVKSYYLHDSMHEAIAHVHSGHVAYKDIIKEGSQVETDINLWRQISTIQKIWCVLEEAYVIALERKILPFLFGDSQQEWTPKEAFDWALYRVCTTLCDGFFREFAVRGYQSIQNNYSKDYVETFLKNISKYDRKRSEEPTS